MVGLLPTRLPCNFYSYHYSVRGRWKNNVREGGRPSGRLSLEMGTAVGDSGEEVRDSMSLLTLCSVRFHLQSSLA